MDLHSLKSVLQQHFTDGLVTVVGSGLSCAEGLPSMEALAKHLQDTLMTGLRRIDIACWAKLVPLIVANGLEAALLSKPPTSTLETAIVAQTAEFIANREREVVAEIFARSRVLRLSRLLIHLLKPTTGIPIITTNYDSLIEIAAEEAGFGVDTLFVGQFAGKMNEQESRFSFCREVKLKGKTAHFRYKPKVNVFKPHGSLDWYHREGRPVRYTGHLPLPRLIITPGLNKFRNGYDSPFDRHRELANRAIDRATRFLVLGYGFNDDHLETHLTPRIKNGTPTLLLTHKLSQNALKLVHRYPKVIAIQSERIDDQDGSLVFLENTHHFLPNLALWDLGVFIEEVLEP